MKSKKHLRWLWVFAILVLAALTLLPVAAALAEEAVPAAEEAVEAPALDYTFTWPTFLLTAALVVGYYVFILRMSEKEFKGIVAERFGPKRST